MEIEIFGMSGVPPGLVPGAATLGEELEGMGGEQTIEHGHANRNAN